VSEGRLYTLADAPSRLAEGLRSRPLHARVVVEEPRDAGQVLAALKRLDRTLRRCGVPRELRAREAYHKPGERRRKKAFRARVRSAKVARRREAAIKKDWSP
jgi:ribosomal protein S21